MGMGVFDYKEIKFCYLRLTDWKKFVNIFQFLFTGSRNSSKYEYYRFYNYVDERTTEKVYKKMT